MKLTSRITSHRRSPGSMTYTMRGSSSEPGIIPLAVQEVFKNIDMAVDREFFLRISYMEIFNEEINDLLAPGNRKLQIHENIERGSFVLNLTEAIVASSEQVLELMTAAHRHVGVTNMNVHSSRSHSIFRMRVMIGAMMSLLALHRCSLMPLGCPSLIWWILLVQSV